MRNWFRKASGDPLPVAMCGVKLGDRLLVVGCTEPKLIAAVGAKAGLTGRVCAVDNDARRANEAARVTEREGVLIETATYSGHFPFPDESFDVVVVRAGFAAGAPPYELHEAHRTLRPGGRCIVMEGEKHAGIGAMFAGRRRAASTSGEVMQAFHTAGFFAVRTLAERGGMLFVEGVKKNR